MEEIRRLMLAATGANKACVTYNTSLVLHLEAIKAGDFETAERLRPIVVGALEATLDEIAAAQRQVMMLRG